MNTKLQNALLTSAASASLLLFAPGLAQAQAADEGVDVGEIVVTGSRIRRDTFSSPQPLSVVSAQAIREQGQVSVGDILLEQPVINPATNAQNSSSTLFLAGQTRADIRGLGPTRTLVLMDGRRLPFSDASSPAVDLNTIPSLMVERIETIAGGASAVYGSEAISGVVNFIMKKEQDGLEIDLQGGTTEEGDGEETRLGFNWGKKFFDDRLNVLIGGEFASQGAIMRKDRDWAIPGIRRDTTATPQSIIVNSRSTTGPTPTFHFGNVTANGVTAPRAVTLDTRDPTRVVRLSAACSPVTVLPSCQDEALFYGGIFDALQGKSARQVVRGYVDYKITENWKAFADVSYLHGSGYGYFSPTFSSTNGALPLPIVLRGDNAYLNGPGATAAALRAEWTAAGRAFNSASTAVVGKSFLELGRRDVKTEREQQRYTGGVSGKFETFGREVNVDGYVQYSKVDGTTTSYNVANVARLQQATDAVLLNGQVVCRDADARAAGCAPWDLINGASREAVLWANGVATSDQRLSQTVAGLNFATNLFELPAGPVGVAFGAEYRKETSRFVQDPLSATGALFFNAIGTRKGQYDTKEAYGEVRIPILKDLPFAEEFSIELAGRVADYSTIGGTDQWRIHAEWAPVKDIRFRATEATAVRAPNIVELFSPQGRNFTSAAAPPVDPCDRDNFRLANATQQAARRITCAAAIPGYNPATFVSNVGSGRPSLPLLQGGNPDLGPEKAHTFQYGVVINPRWVPNLQVSADFFKLNITDSVGSIPINTLLGALCYDDATTPVASNRFCQQIRRDGAGTATGTVGGISEVVLVQQNVASTKVEGWDYAVSYGFETEDMFGRDYGSVALRVDATWMYKFVSQGLPGQAFTQFANTITNATPEWKGSASARWTYDRVSLTWSTLYFGSMIANQVQQAGVLDPYKTGDYFRHDIRVTYRLNDDIRLRAGVLNVFDRNPPALPETYLGTGTGSSQYDNGGRFFFVGANLNF